MARTTRWGSLSTFCESLQMTTTQHGKEGDHGQKETGAAGGAGQAVWVGEQMGDGVQHVQVQGHAHGSYPRFSYIMNGQELEVSEEERDIGVLITAITKPSAQCAKEAWSPCSNNQSIHYRAKHIFMRLYKQFVQPHIEFYTKAWSPWKEADKACLQKVQQRWWNKCRD